MAGGTVFLDEVGELSPRAQAKLLRVLQDGEVRKVGDNLTRQLDLRVVTATNRGFDVECGEGRFRRDLLCRLDVVHIDIPPLRDRPGNIAQLVGHFWSHAVGQTGTRPRLSSETERALCGYTWPGNVRQLQNVPASLAVAAPRTGTVDSDLLPRSLRCEATERRPTLAAARAAFDRNGYRTRWDAPAVDTARPRARSASAARGSRS